MPAVPSALIPVFHRAHTGHSRQLTKGLARGGGDVRWRPIRWKHTCQPLSCSRFSAPRSFTRRWPRTASTARSAHYAPLVSRPSAPTGSRCACRRARAWAPSPCTTDARTPRYAIGWGRSPFQLAAPPATPVVSRAAARIIMRRVSRARTSSHAPARRTVSG